MKEYYIIRPDGTALFELPYQEEFIYHCLVKLLDITPDIKYSLLHIDTTKLEYLSLSACDGSIRCAAKYSLGGEGVPRVPTFGH